MENKYTYEDAFAELQQIVGEIESGEINVDELSEKISRASNLIAICKAKLTDTEDEVEKLLLKLNEEQESAEDDEIVSEEEEGPAERESEEE